MVCVGLCVSEDGYRFLADGGEVNEGHVKSEAPVISLFRCALSGYGLGGRA